MPGNRKLVVDIMSEIYKLIRPMVDEEFWDFKMVAPVPGSVYVIGRQQLIDNLVQIRSMADSGLYTIVFNNSAEGSWTIETQIKQLKIEQLVRDKKILLVTGAPVSDEYPHIIHEHLLTTILDYDENIKCQRQTPEIFSRIHKPFKFLFLNGRARPHRKYLYEKLKRQGVLDSALWTMLDNRPTVVRKFTFRESGIDVMATPSPLRLLPNRYEVPRYRDPNFGPIIADNSYVKQELFKREWGEIYLESLPYIDTYFSLVTETICCESDHSFRTEKIAKPLAMGHPFIVAANRGFYQDLKNLGFRTFDPLIDESFDAIDDAQMRMDRLIDVVVDLCSQNLDGFIGAAREVCEYNQFHLAEFRSQHYHQFADGFPAFIESYA